MTYAQGGHVGPSPTSAQDVAAYVSNGFSYRHDLPDGSKDHIISADGTRTGKCDVCGEQVFDPARMRAVIDKYNQQGDA